MKANFQRYHSRFAKVDRVLLTWLDHPGRHSRTHERYSPDAFLRCKAHHLARGPLRHSAEYLLWGYGETGKALRRALLAHDKRPAYVLELHPRRLGERIHGAPVVRPERLPALPLLPLVVSVAGAFAREEIRAQLAQMGRREGVDYVVAA